MCELGGGGGTGDHAVAGELLNSAGGSVSETVSARSDRGMDDACSASLLAQFSSVCCLRRPGDYLFKQRG